MTSEQEATLRRLCESYCVSFDPAHYLVYPADSFMMPGWAEGWIGGPDHAPGAIGPNSSTIYVGVSPTGGAKLRSAAGTRLAELIASDRAQAARLNDPLEMIEVIIYLNGRPIDEHWTIQRAILEAFEPGAGKHCILREDIDKGGDRVVHHRLNLSITVYP